MKEARTIRSPEAPPETFTYTLTGKRATMTDASGGTTYNYTNRDQVLSKSTTLQGALSYTYDLSGNVASVVSSNANGTNVSYTWDAASQLATVMDHWTNGQTSYAFDQTGQLSNVSYPNGVKHNYTTYDNRDRLTNLNVTGPGGAIASYVQAFSLSGRKTSATEATGRAASYGYDTIYRLLNETVSGDPTSANNGSLGYALDNVGNRSSLASSLAALTNQSFTYDANDRISGDTFDTNGNTLTSSGHTFTYDFADRLKQYDNTVAMIYDGDGNRVARTEGGVTHRFLIDDQTPTGYPQIAEELVPTDGVIRQHTYGVMRISQRQLLVSPNWQVSYYGCDGGGSVRQLFDPSGAVTDTYAYDAFGNTIARTGTTFNEFLYRGEQFDSTLGMYYLRARYYRPQVGRFLTADSNQGGKWKPPSHNAFVYSLADPANHSDPGGHESIFSWARMAGFFGPLYVTGVQRVGEYARGLASLGEFSQYESERLDEAVTWLADRADFLGEATQDLTEQTGRISAAAAQVIDKSGNVLQVVSLSGGHLTGEFVDEIVAPFEIPIYGTDLHAEINILNWAREFGYKVISIAASRGICLQCETAIKAQEEAQQLKIFVGTVFRGY